MSANMPLVPSRKDEAAALELEGLGDTPAVASAKVVRALLAALLFVFFGLGAVLHA